MNVNLLGLQATLLILSILLGPSLLSDARVLNPDESPDENIANSLSIMKKLRSTREGLGSLQQVLHDIDEDLRHQQTRACAVSGGMSEHCLDEMLFDQLNLEDWLKGGLSPGRRFVHGKRKRTQTTSAAHRNVHGSSLGDISRKRNGLEILKRILSEMDSDLMSQQKRTCKLNLGGHCATESAAAAADQWSFLQSPFSPGRRRRDTSLFLSKLTAPKSEE